MTRTAFSLWYAGPAAALGTAPPVTRPPRASDPAHVRLENARAALARHETRLALACFDEAIHLAPQLALAHLGRALCLVELGEEAEAAEALLDALAAPDQDGEVTMHLARMLAKEGSHAEAMDLLGAAFQADESLVEGAARDPAFRSLGDHPRFLQLTGRL